MLRNNRPLLDKIRSTQFLKHLAFLVLGCLSWLGFSYLSVLSVKIPKGRSIYDFPWSSDAPIWGFGFCLIGASLTILMKWSFGLLSEKSKSVLRDFVVLLCLIPINSLIITAFSILVLKVTNSGGERSIEWDWVVGFLNEFISQSFVSMTCIGYFYLTLVNKTKESLTQAQRAKAEIELKTLQQNIEPHFLFNNLNVLSSLIESNPSKANVFLSKLAELYRYILQTQNVEYVPINQELEFARNYVYLLQERFGNAYNFVWQVPESKLNGQMIVPVALQTLIENAVKHNAGSNENPLQILVNLNEDSLSVENKTREKQLTFQTNQSGLQNLKTRYAFLTDKPIQIVQSADNFKVTLPLIHTEAETRA